jgi:hypothetical protein
MNRLMTQAVLCFILCPLLTAQQPAQVASTSATEQPASGAHPAADVPQSSAASERNQAIKNARTICINSETDFISLATLDRALMRQRDWDKLGLSIVRDPCSTNPRYNSPRVTNPVTGDLEIQVNRVVFTHIHTYILTDKASGVVLASGRVRALDGVIASGPMAEQIVQILSAARLPAQPAGGDRGF